MPERAAAGSRSVSASLVHVHLPAFNIRQRFRLTHYPFQICIHEENPPQASQQIPGVFPWYPHVLAGFIHFSSTILSESCLTQTIVLAHLAPSWTWMKKSEDMWAMSTCSYYSAPQITSRPLTGLLCECWVLVFCWLGFVLLFPWRTSRLQFNKCPQCQQDPFRSLISSIYYCFFRGLGKTT